MRDMRFSRPRLALALIMTAVVSYELYAIFIKTEGLAGFLPEPSATHLTPEIAGPDPLVLLFTMRADGLEAVDLYPHPSTRPPQGDVTFTLVADVTGMETMLLASRTSAPAAIVAASRPYRVQLPRIDRSSGRQYWLEIGLPDTPPGHGLRFEAGWPLYPDARMRIGARPEWGDLKFQTVAARTTIARSLARQRRTGPAFARSNAFWIVALVGFTWVLGVIVRDLALAPDAPPAPPGAGSWTAPGPQSARG